MGAPWNPFLPLLLLPPPPQLNRSGPVAASDPLHLSHKSCSSAFDSAISKSSCCGLHWAMSGLALTNWTPILDGTLGGSVTWEGWDPAEKWAGFLHLLPAALGQTLHCLPVPTEPEKNPDRRIFWIRYGSMWPSNTPGHKIPPKLFQLALPGKETLRKVTQRWVT